MRFCNKDWKLLGPSHQLRALHLLHTSSRLKSHAVPLAGELTAVFLFRVAYEDVRRRLGTSQLAKELST